MNATDKSGTKLLQVWIEDDMGRIVNRTEIQLPAQSLDKLSVEDIEEREEVDEARKELIEDYVATLMLGVSEPLPCNSEEVTP